MHLSTIIIGDEVKSRPRFTNCQTFNIRLTRYRISAFSTPQKPGCGKCGMRRAPRE